MNPTGEVPGYAVMGAWAVDEHGEPATFVPNPDYRPSPSALSLAQPTDTVDAAMQRAATEHGPSADVVAALSAKDVYLPVDATGELIAYRGDLGEYVGLFTSPDHVPATVPQLLSVSTADLLNLLPEATTLSVNPGSEVSLTTSSTDLLAALTELEAGGTSLSTTDRDQSAGT
jgi:hypothetical protein